MDQTIINWIFAGFGALCGWVLKMTWTAMRDLQETDSSLAEKVQHIEVLVAGNYVTRDHMDRNISALFQKLDRIEQKLDGKADK